MHLTPSFRPFTAADYPEYLSWFADPQLEHWLGPVDQEWLAHVLQESRGKEFAVYRGEEFIAEVGIELPQHDEGFAVLTNLAVRPDLRMQGIGGKVLSQLLQTICLPPENYWVSYVDRKNHPAQNFFARQGWTPTEEADMIRFEYHPER